MEHVLLCTIFVLHRSYLAAFPHEQSMAAVWSCRSAGLLPHKRGVYFPYVVHRTAQCSSFIFTGFLSDTSAQLSWRNDGRHVTPIFEQKPTGINFKKNTGSWCQRTPDNIGTRERSGSTPSANCDDKTLPNWTFLGKERMESAQTSRHNRGLKQCTRTLWAPENKENTRIVENTEFWHFKSQPAPSWETDKHLIRGDENCQLRRNGVGRKHLA